MKTFRSVDEVLDFAINAEIEVHNFYMKLSDFVENSEMAKVLSDLALDELEHKAKLETVKAGEIEIDEEEIGNLGITDNVKDVIPDAKMSHIDLLLMGIKKEEAARKLYTDLSTIAQGDMFLKLAQEEAEHKLRFELEYDLMTF